MVVEYGRIPVKDFKKLIQKNDSFSFWNKSFWQMKKKKLKPCMIILGISHL